MNLSSMPILILAGGTGTRLRTAVADVPKPMAPIQGRPFLEYQIRWLTKQGGRHFTLLTGYKADVIEQHFGDGAQLGVRIHHSRELEPLGTGGAVVQALNKITEPNVLLLNGDTLFTADVKAFVNAASPSGVTVAIREELDTSRYGRIDLADDGRIREFQEKRPGSNPGWINSGMYVLERDHLIRHAPTDRFSLETQYLPLAAARGEAFAVKCAGEFLDIGLPETFAAAQSLVPKWIP